LLINLDVLDRVEVASTTPIPGVQAPISAEPTLRESKEG